MPEFQPVAKADDIPPGEGATVRLHGRYIAIFNVAGDYHAIADTCPHLGASLGEGWLDGEMIACPWHGWRFNVKTGVSDFMDHVCVDSYEVKVEGADVYVRL